MTGIAPVGAGPPGLLRALVVLHEAESLGAGTSVIRVADELARFGWTMSGWLPAHGPLALAARERFARVSEGDRPLAHSFRGWREPPGWRRRALATPAYLRAFRDNLARTRPHVVHVNTLLSLAEAVVARRCGLPIVLQVHEIPVAGAKRSAAIRMGAHLADVMVAVSDAVADVLRPHADRTPVLVARNGVPPLERPTTNATERPFTVGTVGTVSRVKGTDVFLRAGRLALEEVPELRLEHVGAPHLHHDHGLDEEIAALLGTPLSRSAVMLGERHAEGPLRDWDLFVSPSRSEAFPLAVLEAMSAGLPVIATAVGGVPEQIEHLSTGILVASEDHAAIASWIVRLHGDRELRRRLGAAAAARARSEFTLTRQAENLHTAYLTALDLQFAPPVVKRRLRSRA